MVGTYIRINIDRVPRLVRVNTQSGLGDDCTRVEGDSERISMTGGYYSDVTTAGILSYGITNLRSINNTGVEFRAER